MTNKERTLTMDKRYETLVAASKKIEELIVEFHNTAGFGWYEGHLQRIVSDMRAHEARVPWLAGRKQARKLMDPETAEAPWVLVEGPAWGSAEFLGRWLLAAAEADRELHDQYARNPSLKQISTIEVIYDVSFSSPATKFIELLMKDLTCFPLDLCDQWGEMFTVMAQLGFFAPTGSRCQTTIPKDISGLKIEVALLKLASTEDDESFLHPQYIIVNLLSKTEADAWNDRLECMPWMQRVADHELLLGWD